MITYLHEARQQTPTGVGRRPLVAPSDYPALARVALGAVLLIAAVLRLATIGAQSAWLDEGYTVAVARHTIGYIIAFTAQHDTHPPLYYVALHLWLQLSGAGVVQARLLSLLCGVGAVAALYALAQALFDRATALCAALLLSVSPLTTWYSGEIRMYAMAALWALLALALLVRAISRPSRALWGGYVACAALAMYTDYSAGFILGGALVYSLCASIGVRAARHWWLAAHAALALLTLPAAALAHNQIARNLAAIAWIPAPSPSAIGATLLDLISFHSGVPVVVALLGAGLAGAGVWALRRDIAQPRLRWSHACLACIAVAPLALPLALSLDHPAFLTRTAMMAIYGLSIFCARGIVTLPRGRIGRIAWAALALPPLLAINAASLNAAYATTINENWRGAAQYLGQQAQRGDVLLFDRGFLQLPFDLYWARAGLPNQERGYPYDEALLTPRPQSLATGADVSRATAGARTVWLLARDQDSGYAPDGVVGRQLRPRFSLVARRRFGGGVSVYRFTSLPISHVPHGASWLDAAGVVLRHAAAHDLVIMHGSGASAFVQAWNAYPHAETRLLRGGVLNEDSLMAATSPQTHMIWLITTVLGRGDPAGIARDWLYHHGPQVRAFQTYGPLRLYTFAYVWNKR